MVMSTPGGHKAEKGMENSGRGMEAGVQKRRHMQMTREQKPEEREGGGSVDTRVKSIPDRRNSQCKGPEAAVCLDSLRRPVWHNKRGENST